MKFNENRKVHNKVLKYFWKNQKADSIIAPLYYMFENFSPTISTIILTVFFDAVYNVINGSKTFISKLILYGILFVAFHFVKQIIQLIASISTNVGIFERCMHALNAHIINKAARLPLILYEDSLIMDMKRRAEECVANDRIPSIFMLSIVLSTSVFGVVSLIITLLTYNWILALVAVFSVIQFYIAAYIQEKRKYKLSSELIVAKRRRDYIWSLFLDISAIKEMRIMQFSKYLSNKWKIYRDEINDKMWEEETIQYKNNMICGFIKLLGYLVGVVSALLLLSQGKLSVGVFAATITAFATVQNTIQNHISSVGRIPAFIKYARDFFDFIELPEDKNGFVILNEKISNITLTNLCFKYPNAEHNALNDINLIIEAGDTIAIVGENGSGKTTLTKIILGIYKPDSGNVTINGIDLSTISLDSLYHKVSYLSQDHTTYSLSVKDNVALRDSLIVDDEEIKSVLDQVNLNDLLDDIHIGFGKEFGGIELSGGQKQRLAIARTLYKNGELIVLDEPTSALDPLQENEILEQFIDLSKNRTSIIVSHRIGICTKVDKIIVMKNGKIAEIGTHFDLLKSKGEYHRLYEAQSHWYI